MAKKVKAVVKLQLPAGKATPGPPVGSTLGPHGINIPGFTKEFNEIKKACGLQSGSAKPNKDKVAKLTQAQLEEIAKTKMPDITAGSLEAAKKTIAGTARSMGVLVEE